MNANLNKIKNFYNFYNFSEFFQNFNSTNFHKNVKFGANFEIKKKLN